MPHKKTLPVTPQGGYIDYQDDRLGRPVDTIDTDEIMPPASLTDAFCAHQCDVDGVSGKLPVDTTFENFVEPCVETPRSDMGERPYREGVAAGGNVHNPRYGAITPPNHEGVDNPAPHDLKKPLYPHRRY
jgi:hypothetical protein